MTPWWHKVMTDANERFLSVDELTRIESYYRSVPDRLRAVELLETAEVGLAEDIFAELRKRYPDRTAYSRRLAHDLADIPRVVAQALLADEPALLDRQLTDHLRQLVATLEFPAGELRDAFVVLREQIAGRMSGVAATQVDPYFGRLVEALSDSPVFEEV